MILNEDRTTLRLSVRVPEAGLVSAAHLGDDIVGIVQKVSLQKAPEPAEGCKIDSGNGRTSQGARIRCRNERLARVHGRGPPA